MRLFDSHHRRAGAELSRLYREHSQPVFAYALHLVGSREDAEDLVQVAFLDAHRALERGERIVTPRAWLTTVVKRRAMNMWRDRREQPVADVAEHPSADRPEVYEELAQVRALLWTLPEQQHQAFVLRHWSGLSNREIAEMLDTTEGAVESLLVRARAAILTADQVGRSCVTVRDRLAARQPLAEAEHRHLTRCALCRKAEQRLTRVAAAALVVALVPRAHVATALAASVPGFTTGAGAGAAAGAGGAGAKLGAAKLAATVIASAGLLAATHAPSSHHAHTRSHASAVAPVAITVSAHGRVIPGTEAGHGHDDAEASGAPAGQHRRSPTGHRGDDGGAATVPRSSGQAQQGQAGQQQESPAGDDQGQDANQDDGQSAGSQNTQQGTDENADGQAADQQTSDSSSDQQ